MARRWVWIMAIGLVLAGGLWKSAAGVTLYLGKLKSVCVPSAEFTTETKEFESFGLNEEAVADHIYVWLKGKLPRLTVECNECRKDGNVCSPPAPTFSITVNLHWAKIKGGTKIGYFGKVNISLLRLTLWEVGEPGAGIAYSHGAALMGPASTVVRDVNEALESVLADFAAEYYKAGNP